MTKHLTPEETRFITYDAMATVEQIEREDGPRNAALWSAMDTAAARFHTTPHAPETTLNAVNDACDRLPPAFRVADAYRVTAVGPLSDLADQPHDTERVERAHLAVAQYACAARQLATVLEDMQVALFEHLRSVIDAAPNA